MKSIICAMLEDLDRKPIETAPRDGTILILLVDYAGDDDDHYLYQAALGQLLPTIGFNNFQNDGEDQWKFAGWDWSQDCFTDGIGTPKYWLCQLPGASNIEESPKIDQPWQRDEQVTLDLLLLAGYLADVDIDSIAKAIEGWSDEQCRQAEDWAGAVHVNASDNDDVEVPPMPDHVKVLVQS